MAARAAGATPPGTDHLRAFLPAHAVQELLENIALAFERIPTFVYRGISGLEAMSDTELDAVNTLNTCLQPAIDKLNFEHIPTEFTVGAFRKAFSLSREDTLALAGAGDVTLTGKAMANRFRALATKKL